MSRTTGKAVRLYAGGIHYLIEAAVRDDGVLCERYQERGPNGYRWGAWKVTGKRLDVAALPESIEAGFSTLRPAYGRDVSRLRLPAPEPAGQLQSTNVP